MNQEKKRVRERETEREKNVPHLRCRRLKPQANSKMSLGNDDDGQASGMMENAWFRVRVRVRVRVGVVWCIDGSVMVMVALFVYILVVCVFRMRHVHV